ncbi:uncharacterized protein EI90DRAFT_3120340 [Cantharellus anzutake]|uniref:uncharacterized protein n=1 Tax=Cantharellus anzutake TaxID=1750568 RepID=UPI001904A7B3|nr:uncharacterized protein EI90DRAFT_3120340 [Cantharellus anzutake]KAF8335323.1 hypothetical protein EI90DRAFT_3120340 [Cantharellus anzutake]
MAANDVDLPKEDPLMQPLLLLRHHLSGLLGGGTSNIGFKDKVWNGASVHLLEQCGTVFKPSACKNKCGKLKQIYWAVKQLSEQSGFPWSNENGADPGPEEEQLWIDFVVEWPLAAPFHQKGWPLFDEMAEINPKHATGCQAFHTTKMPEPESEVSGHTHLTHLHPGPPDLVPPFLPPSFIPCSSFLFFLLSTFSSISVSISIPISILHR